MSRINRSIRRALAVIVLYPLLEFVWWLMCRRHWVSIPERASDAWGET